MKKSLTVLLLLPAALVLAQRGDPGRDGGRASVEGRYEVLQREGSIRRTLRLEHDGTAEVITTAKDINPDRSTWSYTDAKRYGKTATVAVEKGPVRHLGRWRWVDDAVVVQFNDVRAGRDRWSSIEMRFVRKDDGLTFDRDTDAYGTYRLVFHREDGRGARFGTLRYDDDSLTIESVELTEAVDAERSLLRIRAGGRLIEAEGRIFRDGDDVRFRPRDQTGEYQIRIRNGRVLEISGRAQVDRRRIEILRP